MPPKKPIHAESPEQGEFFVLQPEVGNQTAKGDQIFGVEGVIEGGAFPTNAHTDPTSIHGIKAARQSERQATANRQKGNRGKHSALDSDGVYRLWVGAFVPGFGPVTERNWEDAKRHTEGLHAKRRDDASVQPELGTGDGGVSDIVKSVAARLSIDRAFGHPIADTHDKLIGLQIANGAGFLPTTNREKNQAFEMLDYLDKDMFPKGVTTRLTEIFYRQQRERQKAGDNPRRAWDVANDSVRSVVNEWGDYAENAAWSLQSLKSLTQLLDSGLNPRLPLSVVLQDDEENTADVRPLVRYFDLQALPELPMDGAVESLITRENRAVTAEKNKTVEDGYTQSVMSEQAEEHVKDILRLMTVKDARKLMPLAIEDQTRRLEFWKTVLANAARGNFGGEVIRVIERVKPAVHTVQ